MIEISCETIQYLPEQTNQSMTVYNKGEISVIYKVKTNNIKAIDARPNTGSIPPSSSVKITIKRNQDFGDNVKIQFTYISCNDPLTKDNFKQIWAKHQKQQKSKTLQVRLLGAANKERKSIQKSFSNVSSDNGDPSLFQSVRVSRGRSMESQPDLDHKSQVERYQVLPPIPEVKKQHQVSSKQNNQPQKKVQQKIEQIKKTELNINEKDNKTKKTNQQPQINSKPFQMLQANIFNKCNKLHIPLSILIVAILVFFLLGFYFGYSKGSVPSPSISTQSL